jgi:outer membrane protein assembly factor BamB
MNLYAVDGLTGAQIWEAPLQFDMGNNETALMTVDEDLGRVYLIETPGSGTGGKLYALDKNTGAVEWYKSKATDDAGFVGDYVLLEGGKIYVPADVPIATFPYRSEHMVRIDTTTEALEYTFVRPPLDGHFHHIRRYGLCADKLVVTFEDMGKADEILVAYDIISPTISWHKSMPKVTGTLACNEQERRIYVPTDPSLYALDLDNGNQVWKHTGLDKILNPSLANGIIYYLSDSNLYAIDEKTHAQLLRYPLGDKAYHTAQVAIANGMLFFGANNGTCDMIALGFPPPARLPMIVRRR